MKRINETEILNDLKNTSLSYLQIAEKNNCSIASVCRIVKKNNMNRRKSNTYDLIIDLLKNNIDMSYVEIAKKTGYSITSINIIARKNGLQRKYFLPKKIKRDKSILNYVSNKDKYYTYKQIANNVDCSIQTVYRIARKNNCKKYKEYNYDINKEEIADYILNHKTDTYVDIAKKFNCSTATINNIVKQYNIKRHKRG